MNRPRLHSLRYPWSHYGSSPTFCVSSECSKHRQSAIKNTDSCTLKGAKRHMVSNKV
jgi:hypothetical protein